MEKLSRWLKVHGFALETFPKAEVQVIWEPKKNSLPRFRSPQGSLGAVAVMNSWLVLDNNLWGIKSKRVDILFVSTSLPIGFNVSKTLGGNNNFPFYKTVGENGTGDTSLKPEQLQLLIKLSEYIVGKNLELFKTFIERVRERS